MPERNSFALSQMLERIFVEPQHETYSAAEFPGASPGVCISLLPHPRFLLSSPFTSHSRSSFLVATLAICSWLACQLVYGMRVNIVELSIQLLLERIRCCCCCCSQQPPVAQSTRNSPLSRPLFPTSLTTRASPSTHSFVRSFVRSLWRPPTFRSSPLFSRPLPSLSFPAVFLLNSLLSVVFSYLFPDMSPDF